MENDQKKYNRVIAYIRKSSEDNKQGEANKQLNSLEYQRTFVNDTIKKHDLELVCKPFEDDQTGYEAFVRDNFRDMLEYIKDHRDEIDGIVCTEISRLARNFGDGGMILWYMQCGYIKRIYTYSKVFTNSSTDQMMVAIEFAMSKKSSDDTGDRTKLGMRNKAITIRHPARPAILGYVAEGKVGAKEWKIDPINGHLVRQVFEQFASGEFTLKEIAQYAVSIGLKSKDRHSKTGEISVNTWRNRLKAIEYTGIFYHDEEKIVGAYEPLISPELYYQVQDVLEGNKHPKSAHAEYAYSGLVKCSRCGGNLSGTLKKGIIYYRCGKKQMPCKELEKVPYMPEKDLENDLMTAFEIIEIDQETWNDARDYVLELNEPEKTEIKKQIVMLGERVEAERRLQIELGRKFGQKELVKSEYDRLMSDSYSKEASLRNAIVKCENILHELTELMYKFLDDIRYINTRLRKASPMNKREMVEIFCENLLWNYEKLRWDWKNPYYLLTKQSKNSTMLPQPWITLTIDFASIIQAFQDIRYIGELRQRWQEIKKLTHQNNLQLSTL